MPPSTLHDLLTTHVDNGTVPGAVALVSRGGRTEVQAVGSADAEGAAPMVRDSIFRIASITKPLTAAAAMMLVDEGTLALDAPVSTWLPELASPSVVRTPSSPADDVVPAVRPITVEDLLTFRAGYGFPSDFSYPAVQLLFSDLQKSGLDPQDTPAPDDWLAALGRIPLLHQPGEAWLYNTCSDILSVLIARASGTGFADFLAERLLVPLGMKDTGFAVPAADLGRFTTSYRPTPDGKLETVDTPEGQWSSPPRFASGAGGLVSTADDWHAFARMLLADGAGPDGRALLSPDAVRRMTTNHLDEAQREASDLFLEGQGWGYGGSVDVDERDPWTVPGRYGWVGGTGTSAHIVPSTGTAAILLTQVQMTSPVAPAIMRDFWQYATTV
ncbi:serine hydrolase domain-containing protein [Streptomyces sp. NPDC050738]|uniref:serine hydrolase domain-containing protein n=1 Tax=Streptomyces sp. NPDC050738 TaxID=3154744 RepID=UPI003445BCA4